MIGRPFSQSAAAGLNVRRMTGDGKMKHRDSQANSVKTLGIFCLCGGALVLAGCGLDVQPDYLQKISSDQPYVYESEYKEDSVLGPGGLDILGIMTGRRDGGGGGGGAGIGVNSYLWRATLDTISFMPLSSADPFGGVIITDWYSPPETPKERVKLNIYILGRELRADGLRVSVFRQTRNAQPWQQAKVDPTTIRDIENAILKRARELRIATSRLQ